MQNIDTHLSTERLDHPVHKLYPFEGGWEFTARGISVIMGWFKAIGDQLETTSLSQFRGLALILAILILLGMVGLEGLLAFLALILWVGVLGTFFALWAGLLLLVIGALRGAHWLYCHIYHIFYPCPFCYEIMPLPLYVCKKCKRGLDTRLWPNMYGIFSHRCCECNAKMPTLDSLGRRSLDRLCPNCQRSLDLNFGQGTPIIFPLIGGVSAGKTCYMLTAIRALKEACEQAPPEKRCTVQFMGEYAQKNFEQQIKVLDSGGRLEATGVEYAQRVSGTEIAPSAFCLKIQTPGRRVPFLIFFYDVPGEVYNSQRDVQQQLYYRYARGALLIIDPCAIPAYRHAHEQEIEALRESLGPSDTPVTVIENRVERMLELSRGMITWHHLKRRMAMAVVVTKVDALNLRQEIALAAENQGEQRQVEEFLRKQGLVNMQEKLKRQFSSVSYFSCSALGRLYEARNHTPYVSQGVLEPLRWLLEQVGVLEEVRKETQ